MVLVLPDPRLLYARSYVEDGETMKAVLLKPRVNISVRSMVEHALDDQVSFGRLALMGWSVLCGFLLLLHVQLARVVWTLLPY